ncbi:Protein FAR1-RELATED SEQUENCE 5 [Abeliophyllum distichum]|uniref:Protein FAR1-RELATED SEQUENCE 5 n=1 Tax=Abeliophyllum distichum TaxID=126358 RepID=A0ABD1US24_9LAMI
MEIDSGGPSSIGCVERDLKNHERNMQEEQRGHDAETLIEHCTLEKEKSPNFYFDYQLNKKNKLFRYFWADVESRRSYGCFGDVVVFDTTYNMNMYSMDFALFVEVNHHEKYILHHWTKNAKVGSLYDPNVSFSMEDRSDKSLMARHGLLAHKALLLVDDASLTDARISYLLGEFENLYLRVKEIDIDGNNGNPKSSSKSL